MRTFNVKVNGQAYQVEVEEISNNAVSAQQAAPVAAPTTPVVAPVAAPVAQPVAAPSAPKATVPAGSTELKAPMPGTIVDFKVANGSTVKKGQPVLILEAMKMENEIAAPTDGAISFVATKGATVNSGDILAVIA